MIWVRDDFKADWFEISERFSAAFGIEGTEIKRFALQL